MKTCLEDPNEIRQQIWKELGRAAQDRHHEWRTPVLATVDRAGLPNARTVVLRAADAHAQTLQIFTDARSEKVRELATQAQGMFVFWSKRLSWQLRVRANVTAQTDGPEVETFWERVKQSAAAGDYLSPAAPGSPLTGLEFDGTEPAAHHFTLVTAQVVAIDWLELGRGNHRRALVLQDAWTWLTP